MRHPYAEFLTQGREAVALRRRRVPGGAQARGAASRRASAWRSPTSTRSGCPTSGRRSSTASSTSAATSPASARSRPGSTGGRAARARAAAAHARIGGAARGVRRRRLLAAVRADLHERAQRAGSVAASRCAAPIAATTDRWSSRAARPRPTPSRWRRSSTRSSSARARRRCPALVREAAALRRAGVPRRERLIRLAASYPLYVPELYATEVDARDRPHRRRRAAAIRACPARPKRALVADINRFPFPDDSPLPYAEAIFDRMAVEVARGCTEGCRFCQAGMIYRPGARARSGRGARRRWSGGVKKGGYDETALTSLSTADYSCVTPLVKAAMARAARPSGCRCRCRRCAPTASTRTCWARWPACAPAG